MGDASNKDITIVPAASWGECCHLCSADAKCKGWTFDTDANPGAASCHKHANDKAQHPGFANRITGVQLDL
jgi:hypothetical protein